MKTRRKQTKLRPKKNLVECCWCHRQDKELRNLWLGHKARSSTKNYGQMMIQCFEFDFNEVNSRQFEQNAKICLSCVHRLKDAVHFKERLFGVSPEKDELVNPKQEVVEFINVSESQSVENNNINDPFKSDAVSVKEENEDTDVLADYLDEYLKVEIKEEEYLDEELFTEIKEIGEWSSRALVTTTRLPGITPMVFRDHDVCNSVEISETQYSDAKVNNDPDGMILKQHTILTDDEATQYVNKQHVENVELDTPEYLEDHWNDYFEENSPESKLNRATKELSQPKKERKRPIIIESVAPNSLKPKTKTVGTSKAHLKETNEAKRVGKQIGEKTRETEALQPQIKTREFSIPPSAPKKKAKGNNNNNIKALKELEAANESLYPKTETKGVRNFRKTDKMRNGKRHIETEKPLDAKLKTKSPGKTFLEPKIQIDRLSEEFLASLETKTDTKRPSQASIKPLSTEEPVGTLSFLDKLFLEPKVLIERLSEEIMASLATETNAKRYSQTPLRRIATEERLETQLKTKSALISFLVPKIEVDPLSEAFIESLATKTNAKRPSQTPLRRIATEERLETQLKTKSAGISFLVPKIEVDPLSDAFIKSLGTKRETRPPSEVSLRPIATEEPINTVVAEKPIIAQLKPKQAGKTYLEAKNEKKRPNKAIITTEASLKAKMETKRARKETLKTKSLPIVKKKDLLIFNLLLKHRITVARGSRKLGLGAKLLKKMLASVEGYVNMGVNFQLKVPEEKVNEILDAARNDGVANDFAAYSLKCDVRSIRKLLKHNPREITLDELNKIYSDNRCVHSRYKWDHTRRIPSKLTEQPKKTSVARPSVYADTSYNAEELTTLLKYTNATPFSSLRYTELLCVYCRVTLGKTTKFVDADVFREHVQKEHDAIRLGMVRRFKNVMRSRNISVDITDLRCTWCDVALPSWQQMFTHLEHEHSVTRVNSLKTSVFPYKLPANLDSITCQFCPRSNLTFLQQAKHLKAHFYLHKCEKCDKSFKDEMLLIMHKCSGGTYVCDHCSKIFKRKDRLIDHIRKIVPKASPPLDVPSKCCYCEKQFTDKCKVNEHVTKEHKYQGFNCLTCRRTFADLTAFTNHYNRCHNKNKNLEQPVEECIECDTKDGRENLYVANENGEKICKDCFVNTRQTVYHNNVRVGFKCHICSREYTNESSLNKHWTGNHHIEWLKTTGLEKLNIKPVTCFKNRNEYGDFFECSVCKIYFNLKHVFRTLENERLNYVCKSCFRETKNTDYDNGVPVGYKCHICGCKFKQNNVVRHCYRMHRNEWIQMTSHKDPIRHSKPLCTFPAQNKPPIVKIPEASPKRTYAENDKEIFEGRRRNLALHATKKFQKRYKKNRNEYSILTEHNYTIFECDLCKYTGPIEVIRDHHKRNHDQENGIKDSSEECIECKIKFSRRSLYAYTIENEWEVILCENCFINTRTGNGDRINTRKENQNGDRVVLKCFNCHICGRKCKHKYSLFNHYEISHREEWRKMRGLPEKPKRKRKRVEKDCNSTDVKIKKRRGNDSQANTKSKHKKNPSVVPKQRLESVKAQQTKKKQLIVPESVTSQSIPLLRVYTK